MEVRVACPAKINRFLAVGPKDTAGYHPIRTVFQAVGLFDELIVSDGAERTQVQCDWKELPSENTLTKVLRLAAEYIEIPPLHIRLQKRIPAQSGLGGGSSDAAGLLRALGRFTRGRLGDRDQMEIARAVGADVPFFLMGGCAKGEGYGVKLTLLEDIPESWLVLARPNLGCDTKAMYEKLDGIEREWREFSEPTPTHNDFELVAPLESMAILANLNCLGARDGGLCGSGSAVYAFYESRADAEFAADRLTGGAEWPKVWAVPTLGRTQSLAMEHCNCAGPD